MDLNVRAFRVVQEAIHGASPASKAKKESSRKGGLIGGHARAASLSAEQRREIARKANETRWKKKNERQGGED